MSHFPCWEMLCPSPGHTQPLEGWFLPGREGGMEGGMFCKLCVTAEGNYGCSLSARLCALCPHFCLTQ